MNATELALVLREHAEQIQNGTIDPERSRMDTSELVRVLARIVEGKSIDRSFGAPGDWGYGTPIGKALAGRETNVKKI